METNDGVKPYLDCTDADLLPILCLNTVARTLPNRVNKAELSPVKPAFTTARNELQHALEVAQAPEVRDVETMARMFRRIGSEVAQSTFETRGAREVAHLIRRELR